MGWVRDGFRAAIAPLNPLLPVRGWDVPALQKARILHRCLTEPGC